MNTLKVKLTTECIKDLWNTHKINAITEVLDGAIAHTKYSVEEDLIEIDLEIVDGVEYESVEKTEKEHNPS